MQAETTVQQAVGPEAIGPAAAARSGSGRGLLGLAMKIALGMALLAVLVLQTDREQFLTTLAEIDPLVFTWAILIAAAGNALRNWKWQVLLQALGRPVSFHRLHALTYMALFFNNFLPGALGGDGFRVLRTASLAGGAVDAAAVVVMDRLTGMIALVLFVCLAAAFDLARGALLFPPAVMWRILIMALLALLGCFLATKLSDRVELLGRLPIPAVARRAVEKLALAFRVLHTHRSTWGASMALSCATLAAMILAMHYYAVAASIPLSLVASFLIVPLSSFLILVPISFNGLGLQEGAFMLFFSALGVDPTSAFVLAIMPRISLLTFSLIGGAVYMAERRG